MARTTYLVSTTNLDGKTISKKMYRSFLHAYSLDFAQGHHFSAKKAALVRAREMNASRWAELTGSVGRWVVINTTTKQIVSR